MYAPHSSVFLSDILLTPIFYSACLYSIEIYRYEQIVFVFSFEFFKVFLFANDFIWNNLARIFASVNFTKFEQFSFPVNFLRAGFW